MKKPASAAKSAARLRQPTLPAESAAADAGPRTLALLRERVEQRYEDLPARLQIAVRFLVDHPADAAVETIKVLAEAADVQPSVLVRLAKAFGYSGFTEMQAVFREALLAQTQSYGERMRTVKVRQASPSSHQPDTVLRELCDGAVDSLQGLSTGLASGAMEKAVALLGKARTIHVLGMRRAAPIANYLSYLLSRSRKHARQLGAVPGMLDDEIDLLGPEDLLVVISFQPFHPLSVQAHGRALERGAKVLAITDSSLSPIAKGAHAVLQVHDAETAGFRSIAGSVVLCHAMAVVLATRDAAR